jgi:hypothetical protein
MKSDRRTFIKKWSIASLGLATAIRSDLHGMPLNSSPTSAIEPEIEPLPSGQLHARLTDHGEALINPGMGWVTYYYSNLYQNYGSKLEPSDTVRYFPGMNTVFLRIPWAFVEPEEGQYVWEILDTPAQRWIEQGGQVGICITATENWMGSGTPKWIYDAGAKSYEVDGYLEPDYDDPIFLEKVENFVRVLAARYDNNPNVAYLFVGHYGMWGEGHTVLTTPKHGKSWGVETQKRMIDLYRRHFKHTTLCISDDYAGHDQRGERFPITDYAFSQGVTIHDDSILVQPPPNSWFHSEMAQLFWPTLPVVLEHEHYGGSVERGAWDNDLLMKAVEDYHASFLSIHWWPDRFYEANKEIIRRINRRIGYRLQVPEITWPRTVRKGEKFTIKSRWANAGVAPCYGGGYPCFTLKDEKGGIVSVLTDSSCNLKELPVSEADNLKSREITSTFTIAPAHRDHKGTFFRTCKPGTYDLYLSAGKLDGTPLYELPYGNHDGHRRYKIGRIVLLDYASRMKADSQIPVECRHRLLSIVTMCLCMLSVYAGRPAQLHCLGNGNYCVFGQGADIESIFGPGYSSPSYIRLIVQDMDSTSSSRIPGTAIWEHTLYKGGEIVARFKDFIDSKSAIYTRMVECLKPFAINIHIEESDRITLHHTSSLLLYKGRGLPFYGDYNHPYEQFQNICSTGNSELNQVEPDLFSLSFKPGKSELYCIGGASFQECDENSRLALTATAPFLLERTKKYWENYTNRRKAFEKLIPESFPMRRKVLDQIDNVAIILKTQQATQGAVIAGHRYHLGYVRDQYGVSRGFLAMGYFEEARKILQFYWDIWQHFGYIRNAQAIGIPGIFHQHENDEVEITGYLIIQAFDYLNNTNDVAFTREILPMLEWAWQAQKRHLVKGMLPFNGDETYVAGGILPRSALNDGSAEATLLFIESGKKLLSFVEKYGLWNSSTILSDRRLLHQTERAYLQNFVSGRQIMANNPLRMDIESMPEYRHGFCAGSHGVLETRKDSGGNYLCPKCIAEGLTLPVIERKSYFLPSLALTPLYLGSTVIPRKILDHNLALIIDNYKRKGEVSSREGSAITIGYEYGFFLYALSRYKEPLAARILADMLSIVDETGAWVEYYNNGVPMGCNYRPWESAINIEAIISYATSYNK